MKFGVTILPTDYAISLADLVVAAESTNPILPVLDRSAEQARKAA